jgi:hypothetical protein
VFNEIFNQVFIDANKLASKHSPSINIGRIGLKSLIITKYLTGTSGGHGRHQQAIPHAILLQILLNLGPIKPRGLGLNPPHIKL